MIENKENKQLGIQSVTHMVGEELSQEAKNLLVRLSNQEKLIKYAKIDFKRDSGLKFYFSDKKSLKELFKAIYYRNLSIDKAERKQDNLRLNLLRWKDTD